MVAEKSGASHWTFTCGPVRGACSVNTAPSSDSSGTKFTELGSYPKLGAGRREELENLAALAEPPWTLVNTSRSGQYTWSLGGTGPRVPGSCDRYFLDLSGAWDS